MTESMRPPPTVSLLLGWTACAITGVLFGMTVPLVIVLSGALAGILGWQMYYEYKAGY